MTNSLGNSILLHLESKIYPYHNSDSETYRMGNKKPVKQEIPFYNNISEFLSAAGFPQQTEPDFTINTMENYFKGGLFSMGPFRRNYYVFVYITEGEGKVTLDNKEYIIKPDMFYYSSPGHVTSIEIDKGLKGYMVSSSVGFLEKYYAGDIYKEFPFLGYVNAPPLQVEGGLNNCFTTVLANILKTYDCEQGSYRYHIISNLLIAFLYKVKQLILISPVQIGTEKKCSSMVLNFMKLLDKHFRNIVAGKEDKLYTVADFARLLHVHPNYLSSRVKKETGKSISHWLKGMIIGEAQNLLLNTTLSVAQISDKLKFDEPTNFTKYFKKKMGRSPKEYRVQAELNHKV